MGRGTAAEFLANSCAPTALRHASSGNSLGSAGERHDLPDAHTTCGGRYPAREASAASVSHRARDERKHRQRGHAGGQSAKHDHRTFLHITFLQFSRSLLPAAVIGLAINFFILRFGFRKVLRQTAIDRPAHVVPKLERGLFVLVCIVLVSIFAGFLAGLNLAWTAMAGAVLVMVLARRDTHECAEAGRLASAPFFRCAVHRRRWVKRYRPARCDLLAIAADLWIKPPDASLEPYLVFRGGIEHFLKRAVRVGGGKWIARFTNPALMWKVLALATTFAGNLTIIGSVANMIVVESARDHIQVGFWDYARFGIPITILTTAAGVAVLLVLR